MMHQAALFEGQSDCPPQAGSTAQYFPWAEDDIVYFPGFLDLEEARSLFNKLYGTVDWRQEHITLYGRDRTVPRLTAWYGDPQALYTYSGIANIPNRWDPTLLALVADLDDFLGIRFNSVLLNLYRDGNDSLSWHTDDEPELGVNPTIASISLGAARSFHMKTLDDCKKNYKLALESGSLLVMRGSSQQRFQHAVLKEPRCTQSRINLTFRVVRERTAKSPTVS
jgi:alkylated DNA repair dioxygenase AlkB